MRSTRSSRCSGRTAAGRNRNRSADAGRNRDRRPAPFSKGRYGPSRTKHMQPTSPCRNEDDIAADIPRQHGILPLPLRRNVRDRPLRALRETELPQPLRHPDGRGPRVAHRPRRQGRQHPQAARVRHAHRLLQTLAAPALDVHSLRLQEFPLLRPLPRPFRTLLQPGVHFPGRLEHRPAGDRHRNTRYSAGAPLQRLLHRGRHGRPRPAPRLRTAPGQRAHHGRRRIRTGLRRPLPLRSEPLRHRPALLRRPCGESVPHVCPPQKNPAPVCGCRTVVSVCSPIYRWAARYTS